MKMLVLGSDVFVLGAMRLGLRYGSGVSVLGVVDRGASLAPALREASPAIVVIDAGAYPDRLRERLREVREEQPEGLVIVLLPALDADLFEEASEHGALVCLGTAAVLRHIEPLLAGPLQRNGEPGDVSLAATAVGTAADPVQRPASVPPECPLTEREREILCVVAEGQTSAQIARELWVTEQTVKFHLSKIYRKLGVANRTEASRYALLNGLVDGRRPVRQLRSLPAPATGDHRVLAGVGG
jgi:DNA-binding NarL/FixJ family response regulator